MARTPGPKEDRALPQPCTTLLFSGHMTDSPDRRAPRFPEHKAAAARRAIDAVLDGWGVDAQARGICGGARGGDLIFAEAMRARGAALDLFLPLPPDAFVAASVRVGADDPGQWEARFEAMRAQARQVFILEPAADWPGDNVFARNTARMLDAAGLDRAGPHLGIVLLWNGMGGDGPGGTADFARQTRRSAARLHVIDPARL